MSGIWRWLAAIGTVLTVALPGSLAVAEDIGVPDAGSMSDVLPRLDGEGAAITLINQALAEADAKAAELRDDCLQKEGSDWGRDVDVTFDGPAFLSVVEYVGYWCTGMAHPWSSASPMTFDRTSGMRVSWDNLLPSLPVPAPDKGATTLSDGLRNAFLAGIAPVPDECVSLLSDKAMAFRLWLDGGRMAVAVMPVGLAYVDTYCVDVAYLTTADLSRLDADPVLIEALAGTQP